MPSSLSWVEIDTSAIAANIRTFRANLPLTTQLMLVVKANAYGHGMVPVARTALASGAGWLGVFHLGELLELRRAGVLAPTLVMGYVPLADLKDVVQANGRVTVSSGETLEALAEVANRLSRSVRVHLKLECGTYRLGLEDGPLDHALEFLKAHPQLILEGAHTHFSNIEDTTEHDVARAQIARFTQTLAHIRQQGFEVPLPHSACSAATLLFPETFFSLARVGISGYGLWPSKETWLSARQTGRAPFDLAPALTWKTKVVQVKDVPSGAFVGYGCTYRTTRPTRLAVLPVGYANGFDRLLSNRAHVLIHGTRAPVRGRVCMNLCMVDVSDIPGVGLEEEVVLLGRQGNEHISPEQMAGWAQTIHYEILARIDPSVPRLYSGEG